MRIGRIELGLWTTGTKMTLTDYFLVQYLSTNCSCYIFTVSRFYLTWLGNECYDSVKQNELEKEAK